MSIIFNDLPLLEAERVSGALSQAEFAKQKSAALDSVPDTLKPDCTVVERSAPRSDTLWLVTAMVCATATSAITGNIAIASTLSITVLAASTIKLLPALD